MISLSDMNIEKTLLALALGLVLFFESFNTFKTCQIMNSTKEETQQLGQNMIESVKQGELDALDEIVRIKKEIEFLESYYDELKPYAIEEREKYPEKRLNIKGALIELSYTGDRLDYDSDPIYKELNDAKKHRQKELKDAYKTSNDIVTSDGELIPKIPVKSAGKQIIKITY